MREIKDGYRYHCNTCRDFDLCEECYQSEKHPHQLYPLPIMQTHVQQAQIVWNMELVSSVDS